MVKGPTVCGTRDEFQKQGVYATMYTGKGSEGTMIDAVISVSRQQAETISAMRSALEHGDNERALEEAKALAGLVPLTRKASTH